MKRFLAIFLALLLTGCGDKNSGLTPEFKKFLSTRDLEKPTVTQESLDGYRFELKAGRLEIYNGTLEVWRSKDEWYIDSFELGDINADEITDFVFILWKSFSFGAKHPARMTNDDASVRCHVFVYSVKDNRVKSIWASSNLPRPIYSFELNMDGEVTPTLSGARLIAQEGLYYTEDFSKTETVEYTYAWSGWGFAPAED
ncbi:MAG: hypothetical protein LBC41_02650 [Clostridiales bacterium]|jgi:hypothetical protein|nr:hypothetical protein [Clostridiales bacterium]